MIHIKNINSSHKDQWNDYVTGRCSPSAPYLYEWRTVFEKSFGIRTHYFAAFEGEIIVGVLPLAFLSSALFGRYIVSVPYLNYGGIVADTTEIECALLQKAIEAAKEQKAEYIELRSAYEHSALHDLPCKQKKVAMLLDLPDSADDLWDAFKSKLRSQIRRAQKEALIVTVGRFDQLDNFYEVFSRNMRDLGTPVYSKTFFKRILEVFDTRAHIVIVFKETRPVAAGFIIGNGKKMEVPWASSLRKYNKLGTNMLLYWSMLKFAVSEGYRVFDFGRSTEGETTYKFKEQWGAVPHQLYWYYWLNDGVSLPELNPDNPKYKLAISMWQKLPVWVTKLIGPHIVKNLP